MNHSLFLTTQERLFNKMSSVSDFEFGHVLDKMDTITLATVLLAVAITYRLMRCFYCRVVLYHNPATSSIRYKSPVDGRIKEMPLDQMIKITCPALSDPKQNVYYPHPLLFNGHLQTIYASFYANYLMKPKCTFVRELLDTKDGGVISLDWARTPLPRAGGTPYVLILHGLTGGSHETYIQDLIVKLEEYDYTSVVMNFRGCAETEVKTPQLYSCSYTEDVNLAIQHIIKKDPGAIIFGVGFSLGSNVLTKYCGQMGSNCPLVGLASVGNPYDMLGGQRNLRRSIMGKFYLWGLGKNLKRFFFKYITLTRHERAFRNSEWLDIDALRNAKDVKEFDSIATSKLFKYKTVNEYYRHGSSVVDIPYIRIPSLFFSSEDDPICPKEVFPFEEVYCNPNAILATTTLGGHLGWFKSGWDSIIPRERWSSLPISQFVHTIIEVTLINSLGFLYPWIII